jgi:competence protein ComEA
MEPSAAPWRALETTEAPTTAQDAATQTRRPWLAIGAALLAVSVAAAGILLAARPDPVIGVDGASSLVAGSFSPGGSPAAGAAAQPAELVVEVGGAVLRPGVYRLAAGSRVGDAVAAAGGYGSRVDASAADRALNLAAPLADGQEIHVPSRDEAAESAGGGPTAGAGSQGGGSGPGGLVDLNRASAEQLDALPGVGPATAAKIIAAREEQPFASVDDLTARNVVGAATLAKFRALVIVSR